MELRRAGIETFDAARDAEPAELLERYLADMARRGCKPNTIAQASQRIGAFLADPKVRRLGDLTPARIGARLSWLEVEAPTHFRRAQGGLSPATLNYYRDSLHSFFAWLVKRGHWGSNPVESVERAKVVGVTDQRRPATVEELERLVASAPLHRAALYLFSATTGLRRNELLHVLEADVDLERRTWTARAAWTKNAEDVTLPLAPWCADVLERYLGTVTPTWTGKGHRQPRGARMFWAVPQNRTLRRDLVAAGIEPETPEGRIDLHALARYTLARWLATERVPLAVAPRLMRHSDPRLTANVYTRFFLGDVRTEVDKLARPRGVRQTVPESIDKTA